MQYVTDVNYNIFYREIYFFPNSILTMKRVSVTLTQEADEIYQYLESTAPDAKKEKSILDAFNRKVELIKTDIYYGQQIPKKLFPRQYKKQYGVTNLWRVELPSFWRIVYTITSDNSKIEIVILIIDILDHRQYDNIFGYKKQ
jgi:mRNA-degrading endonuclease RelE of RelBE toxin-antitoxin system